jgi:hypothetical protein
MNHSTFEAAGGTTRVLDRAECMEAPMDQTTGRTLLSVLGLLALGVLVLRWVTDVT